MVPRICSVNILIFFLISFLDISFSRSIGRIGASEYVAPADFSGDKVQARRMSDAEKTFQNHVRMLKQVNGFKNHNIFNAHKDIGPFIYIVNPLEAKVPKAYLTQNEYKQAIINRVVRLNSSTRKNTIFWYTGKIAPTRTSIRGRIDIGHNYERKPVVKFRPEQNRLVFLKNRLKNVGRIIGGLNRDYKKNRKINKNRTNATTKMQLRQHSKSHKRISKPYFRSKDQSSALKTKTSSKSNIKRTVLRASAVENIITSTAMPTEINHPAIRISHASIHGTEDEVNFKDNVKLVITDLKEISGLKNKDSLKTGVFSSTTSDIESSSTIKTLLDSNKKAHIIDSSSIVSGVDSWTATEVNKRNMTATEADVFGTIITSVVYSSVLPNKTEESSTAITKTKESSMTANDAIESRSRAREIAESGTTANDVGESRTTATVPVSSTAANLGRESGNEATKTDDSSKVVNSGQSSIAASQIEESSTADNDAGEFSTTATEIEDFSTTSNDAEESYTVTNDTDENSTAVSTLEKLAITEREASPPELEESTTIATETPVTRSKWKPHTISRPLVFMGKGFSKK